MVNQPIETFVFLLSRIEHSRRVLPDLADQHPSRTISRPQTGSVLNW